MSCKQRRLNLIVYFNHSWHPNYKGDLLLTDLVRLILSVSFGPSSCAPLLLLRPTNVTHPGVGLQDGKETRIAPVFNRAVIFDTTGESYHGMPEPICCPQGRCRKSVALYYLTDPIEGTPDRKKAKYFAQPHEQEDKFMDRLRTIRSERRLEERDLASWDGLMEQWPPTTSPQNTNEQLNLPYHTTQTDLPQPNNQSDWDAQVNIIT